MGDEVVLELAGVEEHALDDVVEAELADGDEDGAGRGPVRPGKQLPESLLAGHAKYPVDGVFVAENPRKKL